MSANTQPSIILMGVQGSGKSEVGAALAALLHIDFIDGDDLHPAANKEKMRSGHALNDEDRLPWLKTIGQRAREAAAAGKPVIIACSALKRWYREVIRHEAADVVFVHLHGDYALIEARLQKRSHEYMPTTLLGSQFDTLEPLAPWEAGVVVDINPPIAAVATAAGEWYQNQL